MGLFSKEACVFCGKEVGMMHRSKMSGGDYICTDCKHLTHPFIRIDKVDKVKAKEIMDQVAMDEARFQSVNWDKVVRHSLSKNYVFYYSMETGEFALYTPETERYPNHAIYYMSMVRPYDKNLEWSLNQGNTTRMPALSKQQYADMITLKEQKDSDGKITGWEIYIPYFREHMDITIKFPGNTKENEVTGFHQQLVNIIGGYNTHQMEGAVRRMEMQQTNAMQTASEVLKAVVKGEGKEGIIEKLQEGIDTANDIEEGKVKRGLFGRLKKKD